MPTPFEDPGYLEAVYAALFALLQSIEFPGGAKFNTMARTADAPDDIPPASQPALRLYPGPLLAEQTAGQSRLLGPTKWTFSAGIGIYLRADTSLNANPLPATLANNFIWPITQLLGMTTPPNQKQTLGGLVYQCWIEGPIETQIVSEQMSIAIPVYILPGPYGV